MTKTKREQLKTIIKNREEKINVQSRPLESYSVNTKMPHERRVEIGERIIKEKIMKRT